jgi:hypothetical protein
MLGIRKKQPALDQTTVLTDFEVRCDHCGVTYPVETKRCMYCGGRPGHRPLFARQIAADPLAEFELSNEPLQPEEPVRRSEAPFGGEEEDVEQPRSSVFRLFGNLSWIILFALLTLYRACTG